MKQSFLLIITIILLVACSPKVDQEVVSQPKEEKEEKTKENLSDKSTPEKEYTFNEFMEEHTIEMVGEDIPYHAEEDFVGMRFALQGKARITRYYNYGYKELEATHYVMEVVNEGPSWHVYVPRSDFPELFQELKKGVVDVYVAATIPSEYFEIGQNGMAIAAEVHFTENEAEEQPLDERLTSYMKKHGVERTAKDVIFDKKGMSDKPFALNGYAQLVTYAQISPEYRDLEPTHFVLEIRDESVLYEQLWRVALDRQEYRELYEQALKSMVHVTLTANMPVERFRSSTDLAAIGSAAEYELLPEKYEQPSKMGLAYMKAKGLLLTDREVMYDKYNHSEKAFLIEGAGELTTHLPIGYEDIESHYFGIRITEDPFGDQYVPYGRAIEGWTLILQRQKYPEIYEQLIQEEALEFLVTARVFAQEYVPGQGNVAFVEDIVVKEE
ncbi:hypothetical protein [Sutcliffiella horikoshii]|uniref:hypothetical protein n=1 Tax=Sutcliffiella horikoshii TaxID=79883 RepID=UPI001CFC6341|nr:hypothetical protein [Sutcliffiella horikoshii]